MSAMTIVRIGYIAVMVMLAVSCGDNKSVTTCSSAGACGQGQGCYQKGCVTFSSSCAPACGSTQVCIITSGSSKPQCVEAALVDGKSTAKDVTGVVPGDATDTDYDSHGDGDDSSADKTTGNEKVCVPGIAVCSNGDSLRICTVDGMGYATSACPSGCTAGATTCNGDIDECTNGTHNCHSNAVCSNMPPGSFTCDCKPGYKGDGKTCTAEDKCQDNTHDCDPNADCAATGPGTFKCTCKAGYEGSGKTCTPEDKCQNNTHNCHTNADCTFTGPATFTCKCQLGFHGDGTQQCTQTVCKDIKGRNICAVPSGFSNSGNSICGSIGRNCSGIPVFDPVASVCQAFHPGSNPPTSSVNGTKHSVYCNGATDLACNGRTNVCHDCPACTNNFDCATTSSQFNEWYADCGPTCKTIDGRVVCVARGNASDTGTSTCQSLIGRSCDGIKTYNPLNKVCLLFHPSAQQTSDLNGKMHTGWCDAGATDIACTGKVNTCHDCPLCTSVYGCGTTSTQFSEWFVDCGAE